VERKVCCRSRQVPWAAGQEAEAAVEPMQEFLRSHDFGPRRGKLDGERDAIEPATDFRDDSYLAMIKI
jgi:hypothetical protein